MSDRAAIARADDEIHRRLRSTFGLVGGENDPSDREDVAYCGRDFRVYRWMRVADAVRFYGAVHTRWNASRVRADLDAIELRDDAEVKRLRRAYQRALVLILACATDPRTLVVEWADEIDDGRTAALLGRAIAGCAGTVITYRDEIPAAQRPWFDRICDGDAAIETAGARS